MGNLDLEAGLCKGELALVMALGDRTITVKLLDPPYQAQDAFMLFHIIQLPAHWNSRQNKPSPVLSLLPHPPLKEFKARMFLVC